MPAKRRGDGRARRAAFTLVEMMVAVGLMTIIVAVAAAVFRETSEIFRVSMARVEIYQNGRAILDKMETELRAAYVDASGNIFKGYNGSSTGPDHVSGTDAVWFRTLSEYQDPVTNQAYRAQEAFYYVAQPSGGQVKILRKALDKTLSGSFTQYDDLGFYVDNMQLQYVDSAGNLQDTWDSTSSKKRPVAVKILLVLTDSNLREKQTLVRVIALG